MSKVINDHFPSTSLLACVTTDNGSNFVKAAIGLLHTLDEGEIDHLGPDDWDHQVDILSEYDDVGWRCVAHTMQLAVVDVLNPVNGSAPPSI